MIGNARAVSALERWADGWAPGAPVPRKRAVLLEGPPGVGKTTAVWALARDRSWSVVEMNASEARNRRAIELVAGRAARAGGFLDSGEFLPTREGGRTLILLDEADCLSGRGAEVAPTSPATKTSFREFVRSRYGSLADLATSWGLGKEGGSPAFERWEQIPLSGGRASWTRLPGARRDLDEWQASAERRDYSDRGGLGAIADLVRSTLQPLALTVNDASPLTQYSPVFRTGVDRLRFERCGSADTTRLLRRVVLAEHHAITPEAVSAILRRSNGDLRAALNDLEAIAPLPAGPLQASVLSARDDRAEIERFLGTALSAPRYWRSAEIRSILDTTPDDLLPWVEQNGPSAAVGPGNRVAAIEVVAAGERFLTLARRKRHWGLWSYASELLTGGVSATLHRPATATPVVILFPQFLGEMGRSRTTRALRLSIAQKLGRALHGSRRKSLEAFLPLLLDLFDRRHRRFSTADAQRVRARLLRELELTLEEAAYLLDEAIDSPRMSEEWERAHPPEPAELPLEPPRASAQAVPEPESHPKRSRAAQRKLGEFGRSRKASLLETGLLVRETRATVGFRGGPLVRFGSLREPGVAARRGRPSRT
jgi:replication factor C large subunit